MQGDKLLEVCKNDAPCHFARNLDKVGWMATANPETDGDFLAMPHLGMNMWVCFCPTCGADIRSVVIERAEFENLLTGGDSTALT